MPTLSTDAVVLHLFDYSETSRIVRLATRDAGVVSVIARGARRSKSRFGTALDLFAHGTAHLILRDGRELQTLTGFDVNLARPSLGTDLGRFAGASAVAELVLRFGTTETEPALFDALTGALEEIAAAAPRRASEAALAAAWRLIGAMGFAPATAYCGSCHAELATAADCAFDHAAGGALCPDCARQRPGRRTLPAAARRRIATWSELGLSHADAPLAVRETRAHQRLLREFLLEHLADGRTLRAFDAWEHGGWSNGSGE